MRSFLGGRLAGAQHRREILISVLALLAGVIAAPGASFVGTTPALAQSVDPPEASTLLEQPYESTGTRVTVTGLGVNRGLTNDGTNVYILDSNGSIVVVPLSSITQTPGTATTVAGTSHSVNWGIDGAPSRPDTSRLSISYSHGCLFVTNDVNTLGSIRLYCIDTSTFEVSEVDVPVDKPLPVGYYFTYSSLIDFPDGRIGKVSAYEATSGGYTSTLRTYSLSGTGSDVELAWSTDYEMFDTANFAVDEHGIATDGTYLYRIQWRDFNPNTKVWALQSDSAAEVVYSGNYTRPFGNMHYLSHNHTANNYLVGNFDGPNFFITSSADPGPGPGNPLSPALGTPTPTADGFTVQIANYDADFTWTGTATAGGTVSVSDTGLVTVTGVAADTATVATIRADRSGYPTGSAIAEATSLAAPPTTVPSTTAPPSNSVPSNPVPPSPVPSSGPTTSVEIPTTTAPRPVFREDGSAPEVEPGAATVTVDGKSVPAAVAPNPRRHGLTVSGDGFTMSLQGTDDAGGALELTTDGRLVLRSRSQANIWGTGFAPGSPIDVWIFSEPIYLGRIIVGSDGTFAGSVEIPDDVVDGLHTIQANGVSGDGAERSTAIGAVVSSAPRQLAFTGGSSRSATLMACLLLACGSVLVRTRRPSTTR